MKIFSMALALLPLEVYTVKYYRQWCGTAVKQNPNNPKTWGKEGGVHRVNALLQENQCVALKIEFSFVPGQSQAQIQAGWRMNWEQLWGEGFVVLVKLALCTYSPENQPYGYTT